MIYFYVVPDEFSCAEIKINNVTVNVNGYRIVTETESDEYCKKNKSQRELVYKELFGQHFALYIH